MEQARILVVDDDKNLLELLAMRLEAAGYDAVPASREEEAISAASEGPFDLAILDLQLRDTDGISLMEKIRAITPDLQAIILTAYGTIESAVEAMRRGAFTYLTKPFDPQELLLQIERALENRKLQLELKRLQGIVKEMYSFEGIVARSAKMQIVFEKVSLIARTDSTVYIHGESGTGKELIAKAIHTASPRKDEPFVAINCAAIPETLLESELFG
ncbi:MAG: sigma-54-dependent Fis family transcriptional regulator, partial [Nitrospirales bacterium]|nr:sigma-54-dependent Fis family transcriptional regulator [Nitrospirales bacterium]